MIPVDITNTGADELLNVYEKRIFLNFPEGIRPGGLLLTEHLVELCSFKHGEMILDIGCGSGISLDFISRKYLINAAGIDLSGSLLKKSHENFPDLHLVHGNGKNLPFRDSSFNGVIAECTLSAMGDLKMALSEIKRILAHNGKLAISDIYLRQPDHAYNMKNITDAGCISGAFIHDEIIKMLNDSGFNVILWEDHSKAWREFVAGLILNNISICEILSCNSTEKNDREVLMSVLSKVKPGYFCLIAGKIV